MDLQILKEMFKGISTAEAFEQCMKRGLCENHIKEINQNELAFPLDEIPRKSLLFIRVNILYTILFNKSTKCESIKRLLQKTPIFSRTISKGDASEAADAILILDSVVVFILCQFSRICCIGAIFEKNNGTSEDDPEIKLLKNVLFVDRFDGSILYQLFPVLEKNFDGFDMNLIKISYILTLLFVRSVCVKLDIKSAIKAIEDDIKNNPQWENCKSIGDALYQKGNYKDACSTYTTAVTLNSYSSALFTQRAHAYIKLGKFKAAQVDAYIAITIDPKWCEGYYVFSSSLVHQKLYQEAFNISKYGLAVCEPNTSFYDTLQAFHIEIETKYINKEPLNNLSENSVNQDLANKPLPEKKYFPVLVDSDSEDSETEACQKNFPELVDASDSDESENTEKKIKLTPTKNKTKKKRIVPENSSNDVVTEMDIDKIRTYLKEASEAVLSDCGYKAVQIFRGPLRDFIDSPKLQTFEECEIVCIKYAYGIAYHKSGGYDDLLKCITILKEIIERHDSITFPAASYALGLTYRKLNRFKEALGYLETVQNFLSKGIHFKVYSWPEILTVIEETKPNILKILVSDLIKECENPPNADALCRFADCSYQPTIYYSDPDFKGYMSLFCSEQCCLQYHLQCWKIIKAEKNLTDKEFLDAVCFTPDCDGVVIKIQHIDKKGDLTKEFISDFKKPGKQKWAKWEKKTDAKEKKKKKANSKYDDGSTEVSSDNGKASSRKNSDSNDKFIPVHASGTIIPPAGKHTTSSENILVSLQRSNSSELDVGSKINDICSSSVNSFKESKENIDISEINESSNFQKATYFYDSEEGKVVSSIKTPDVTCIPDKDKGNNFMQETTVISHFQNESEFSQEKVQEDASQCAVSQCIKENLYSFMNDFLQHHGPLKIDDPLVINELASFPDECSSMVAECGGIGEFLKNDLRFAFVGDTYICVISDMAKAYRMNSNSLPSDLGQSFQSLESTDNSQFYNEHHLSFSLNPDAVEYTPVVSSLNGHKEDHRTENSVENLNYRSSIFKTESSELPFTTNAISENQNDKSESCDTVIDVKLNNSDLTFEQTEVKGSQEDKEELFNKATSLSEVNSEIPNLDDANYNQNFIEGNENLCDVEDVSPSHVTVETTDHIDSDEDSELKEFLLLLSDLKEYCDKDFEKYHKYINDSLKPYALSKVAGTKTDFECTVEDTNSSSLKAKNKELEEDNLSLKKQLVSANKDVKKFSDEVYELKINLSRSSFDLEALKIDFKKKEETLQNGREYLIKSLTQAHSSIDEHKKRIELLESLNSRLEETVDELTSSVNEAEEKMKNAVKAEEKKHVDIIKSLQEKNEDLKNRLKCSEVQFLQTKKAEFLKRIKDKFVDVSRKRQELTRGLTLMSANLNPVVQSSMKVIFAQFSSYEDQLKTLKLEFLIHIDQQIEKVEKGTPLKELKDIEFKIPDPPHSLLPEFDKNPSNSSPMSFNLFNMSSWPQMPSIIPTPTASASTIPPSAIIPPANPLASVIKSSLSSAIPTAKSATAVIPQVTPSATIIPQSASSVKIPQTLPSASIIPHATSSTKILQASAEPSHITHSVLASVIPDIGTNPKKPYDSLDTKIKEPLRNSGISINPFSSIPYTVPTLDKEFNKTCEIFKPPDSVPNKKSDTFKAPPGIVNSATNLVSSRTASNSSKDSLETFPIGSGAIGSVNLASSISLASSVNEQLMNSSEEKKKLSTQKKPGSSYERLLQKLKEEFPSCSQEELLSLVKEFRSRREGKLTGLPIDAIVKELRTIIDARRADEKKISEQKMQSKANKVLVNKKLVIDPKAPPTSESQPSVKKKSAWNTIDTDCKTFSGNPDDDCIICCDPMTVTSAYKVACGHTFHEQCIRQWLTRKSDCPVCRVLLLLPEEYPSLT